MNRKGWEFDLTKRWEFGLKFLWLSGMLLGFVIRTESLLEKWSRWESQTEFLNWRESESEM